MASLCVLVSLIFVLPVNAAKYAEVETVSVAKFRQGTEQERKEQVGILRKAFQTQGVVVLVDHQVPASTIDNVISKSREFFALPMERKQSFRVPAGYPPRSYATITQPRGKAYMVQQKDSDGDTILNEWILVRNNSMAVNWSDPYYTSPEGLEFYSDEEKHPEQQVWPEEVSGLQEATAAYYAEMQSLATSVNELFALALNQNVDYFTSRSRHAPIWPVTIAHYPPQSKQPAEGKMRIQPHWDRTQFALVTSSDNGDEDSEGGLQILVDAETGEGVDGRATLAGRKTEWRTIVKPPNSFVVNVGEMMNRWSNGQFHHVVHRVPNPKPAHNDPGRVSLMAYVLPDYDVTVDCLPCKVDGSQPLYEKTWIGELMNWGSKLPIYNATRMDLLRQAQGLYTSNGEQTKGGEPTDVKALEAQLIAEKAKQIDVVDVAPLRDTSLTQRDHMAVASALSRAFEKTGFAVITGHGVPDEVTNALRQDAYAFFRGSMQDKIRFDKGQGYGFGGYVNRSENGAQLLGDFSRPNDAVESLHVGLAGLQSGVEAAMQANQGPAAATCSTNDISGCEMEAGTPQIIAKSATTFLHSSEVVARLARKALQLSLNASTAELDEFIDTVAGGLRLAYYPAQLEPPLPGQMRYGAHVDSGGITVISLDTSNTGGLQVDLGGSGVAGSEEQRVWVDVPFVPGSLVLNVGALLSRWTAGRWKASVHRVLTDNTQMERLSIITSVLSPRIDGPAFGGFQSVVNENGQPPVRAADYLANRVALHRPEYKTEKGLFNEELMAKESERIQMLSI